MQWAHDLPLLMLTPGSSAGSVTLGESSNLSVHLWSLQPPVCSLGGRGHADILPSQLVVLQEEQGI